MGIEDKIKRLLDLSQSPNQAEAELALAKAMELMHREGLTMLDLQTVDNPFEEFKFITKKQRPPEHMVYLSQILIKHFNVRVLIGKGFTSEFLIIGRKHHMEIAKHIFLYLSSVYEKLWKQFQNSIDEGIGGIDKRALKQFKAPFYQGITSAIHGKLSAQKEGLERVYGLVPIDPDLKNANGGRKTEKYNSTLFKDKQSNPAFMAGVVAGQNVPLNQAVKDSNVQLCLK